MSTKSSIEWTETTWNPITGCTKISPGCKNCYAEKFSIRLKAMGVQNYKNGFNLSIHRHLFDYPLKLKKPQIIFVNSMSDLFHQRIHNDHIIELFNIMTKANRHIFQILTKRSKRLIELDNIIKWPNNVWMGVSIESNDYINRLENLKKCGAKIKFISCEPLLGPLSDLDVSGLDWVIVGGESGPGSRPILKEWIVDIKNQCSKNDVPFYFKQWGGFNKKKNGKVLEGKIWQEMPQIFNDHPASKAI